jgi:hypothetical protein
MFLSLSLSFFLWPVDGCHTAMEVLSPCENECHNVHTQCQECHDFIFGKIIDICPPEPDFAGHRTRSIENPHKTRTISGELG